jgi:lipid-A-disaccharide synthase
MSVTDKAQKKVFIAVGEESGDQLGFKLMRALKAASPAEIVFTGVGGAAMQAEGLASVFPMSDIAVMGFAAILPRLPVLLRRIDDAARACIATRPDTLVIIDSPDFTHRVARKVRRVLPGLPIIDYVSPSVWAWRPGRARKMRAYVDEVLALLPFEPEAHRRLGGPRCTYVGHPLSERLDELRPNASEARARETSPPMLLLLPGSRRSEIDRLMPVFGAALERVTTSFGPVDPVLPAVTRHAARVEVLAKAWPVRPRIVGGEAAKFAAFRRARAALAASGTVSLELALAQVPMVIAYKMAKWEEVIARRLVQVSTIVLPNLILGEKAVPEFIQADCTAEALAQTLAPLLTAGPERSAQLAAFGRLGAEMTPQGMSPPSEGAAARVLHWMEAGRRAQS